MNNSMSLSNVIVFSATALAVVTGCPPPPEAGETDSADPPIYDSDPCDFDNWGDDIYHFKCSNDTDNIWEANGFHGPYINVCKKLAPNNPDPTDGSWQSSAKEACSAHCNKLADQNGVVGVCEDENWYAVEATYNGNCIYRRCQEETPGLLYTLIESVLGLAAAEDAEDLPCDLAFDCDEYLSPEAANALWTEPVVGVEQTADTAVVTTTGSQLYVLGAGQGTGTTEPLTGEAAFTATSCGADACPFYLAQYELEGTSVSFNFTFAIGAMQFTKTITGLTIQLEQPALGLWLPGSGDVIFPSGSLQFRVSGTLSGTPQISGENGFHDDVYPVGGYVFGSWDPLTGDFTLGANGELGVGTFTISGVFL
jgi:hypothetical protein